MIGAICPNTQSALCSFSKYQVIHQSREVKRINISTRMSSIRHRHLSLDKVGEHVESPNRWASDNTFCTPERIYESSGGQQLYEEYRVSYDESSPLNSFRLGVPP